VKLGSNCGTVTASRFQPTSTSQSGYREAGRPLRIVAKAGWIASRHEMGEPWAQVAAKRDGIVRACICRLRREGGKIWNGFGC
jgi:hypothetical protein